MRKWLAFASAGVLALGVAACGDDSDDAPISILPN